MPCLEGEKKRKSRSPGPWPEKGKLGLTCDFGHCSNGGGGERGEGHACGSLG